MINVFGYLFQKGVDPTNEKFDGAEFISKSVSAETLSLQEHIEEKGESFNKKSALPLPLSIIKHLTLWVGMIMFVAVLRSEADLSQILQNAPWVFYIGVLCLIIYGLLIIAEKLKKKKIQDSNDFLSFSEELEDYAQKAVDELGIPHNAPTIDVFLYSYKLNKKNEPVQANSDSKYVLTDMFIFQDEKTLYLADRNTVFAFSKASFVKIEKIGKRTTFRGWTKDDAFNSDKYKKYKMTANQYGTIFCKTHYSLQLSKDGKIFEILIPPYEIATFAKILNLQYEE